MIDINHLTPIQKRAIVRQCRGLLNSVDRELCISSGVASRVFNGKATCHRAKVTIEKRIAEMIANGKLKLRITAPAPAGSSRTLRQAGRSAAR